MNILDKIIVVVLAVIAVGIFLRILIDVLGGGPPPDYD